jgi:hypothetical protein
LDYSKPVAAAMISANRGDMTPAGAERRRSREKFLLGQCRIRDESFVEQARGGRRGRRDKGVMG